VDERRRRAHRLRAGLPRRPAEQGAGAGQPVAQQQDGAGAGVVPVAETQPPDQAIAQGALHGAAVPRHPPTNSSPHAPRQELRQGQQLIFFFAASLITARILLSQIKSFILYISCNFVLWDPGQWMYEHDCM
jgi:hypothetical protein